MHAARETPERQRAEHEREVAERDVVVRPDHHQIHHDQREPSGDPLRRAARDEGDEKAKSDLDHADPAQEDLRRDTDGPWDRGCEVLQPVDHRVQELVSASEDQRDGERVAEQEVGLVRGVGEIRGDGTTPFGTTDATS